MRVNYVFCHIICCILFCFSCASNAQEKTKRTIIGFSYGIGSQNIFPFNSEDYTYDIEFYKIQLYYTLKNIKKWRYELKLEPSIYKAEHQLLNKHFIQPDAGEDYLEQRELFSKNKRFNEYALNLGLQIRYQLNGPISVHCLASTGPMISDVETERMAKGFAFSNIFATGISYNLKKLRFNLNYSLRHVSNGKSQFPNHGYNSANIEFGVLIN